MAALSFSLSLSDCWLYCSQLWCSSCGIQIASVISSVALCAWPPHADIRYQIDRSPPSSPQSPSSATWCPLLAVACPSPRRGWHSRGLWDWLSWVELGKEIAGLLHPLTWLPQWAFVWWACAKPHPSSSNGFWSATSSIRHYCCAWLKPTVMQAGRQSRRRVLYGRLERAPTAEQGPARSSICACTAWRNPLWSRQQRRIQQKAGSQEGMARDAPCLPQD